ncbi:LAME_0C07382g1_1 [Lachancea meyersii CBS 8951]|uniref:LAME_0C07382g1_1 n=1 Tax=Lachancea meyersii CBS 8951 TaxID=1266667 RepID=A0A1G4J325_9SACH|nr:LAME_0C07382g1_1 [Lachancea meyersii CBS 8951]
MQTGAIIQHGGFQELQNLTVLPRIKILQKGSKVRPSLPSIRQLLRDINSRGSENNFSGTGTGTGINGVHNAPGQAHVYSSVSPEVKEPTKNYTRLSQNSDNEISPAPSSEAPRSHADNHQTNKSCQGDNMQFVRLQPYRTAPQPPTALGHIKKPSGELLKLAYAVEASSFAGRGTLTGNHPTDSIIQLNGDYQLKVADTLDSLQVLYRNLQEWPLSMHSQDVGNHDDMALLIDYVSPDSLELTIRMAKRAYDALKTIEHWKIKYKRLHPGISRHQSDKAVRKKTSPRTPSSVKSISKKNRHHQIEFLTQRSRDLCEKKHFDSLKQVSKKPSMGGRGSLSTPSTQLEDASTKAGLQCAHCLSTKTPEWRKGPYGRRSLCNACGLFYKKLFRKFGDSQASMIMKYRKRISSKDRKVPRVFDVPEVE